MAELATIARPYAEALFKAAGSDAAGLAAQIDAVAGVAADGQLRRFADNPKVADDQVHDLITSLAAGSGGAAPGPVVQNLVRLMIENGRLDALPEVAAQFQALVNAGTGTSNAVIHSAFPIEPAALADVTATLEKRFGRRLETRVVVDPELIGGIRVVVGDEVLDTSVKARLEQMRAALTA